MTSLFCLILAAPALWGAGPAGMVIDPDGAPVAGARVVLETGLAEPLLNTATGADGRFVFPGVDAPSFSLVASAAGWAHGGMHFQEAPAPGESVTLRLVRPGTLRGRVVDAAGKPVAGARVVRAAVLGAQPVAVPIAKMAPFGVETPVSDAQGRFEVPGLPDGAEVALKIAHSQFAQEGTNPAQVGGDITVTLTPGTLVRGLALRRDDGAPAPGARVTFRSAHPPHDTTLVAADEAGAFLARLKPGHYLHRAEGGGLASVGWEPYTANVAEARLNVYLGPTGRIAGVVRDAESGAPIAGARLVVQTEKTVEAYLRTGADGTYGVDAAAGEYVVALTGAPGYFPPSAGGVKVRLAAGETLEIPGQWLAPIAPFRVLLLDSEDQPVPGALVTLLRPAQFGWTPADDAGWATVHVGRLPDDGRILGIAEDPARPLGALFVLSRETGPEARVRLLPLGRVEGSVRNTRGRGVAGASVAAYFPGEDDDTAAPLWRTVTGEDGGFAWHTVIPGVPIRCVVRQGGAEAQSATFSLDAGGQHTLDAVRLDTTGRGTPRRDVPTPWRQGPPRCGPPPDAAAGGPAWILHASPAEAPAAIDAAAAAQARFGSRLTVAVVVEGSHACVDPPVPVYSGRRPGAGSSYLLDGEGRVVLECFGLPPARAIAELLDAAR